MIWSDFILFFSFSTSSGSGFEAFFTPENVLVVAVYNRKDYCSVCLSDYPLKDSFWVRVLLLKLLFFVSVSTNLVVLKLSDVAY